MTRDAEKLLVGTTPGPWSAETVEETRHPRFGILTAKNVLLAKAWMSADARLIAAAPDLARDNIALREALATLARKYAAAWAALDFAHSEGFEWPTDPFGPEALAFADPTVVPEYAALNQGGGVK